MFNLKRWDSHKLGYSQSSVWVSSSLFQKKTFNVDHNLSQRSHGFCLTIWKTTLFFSFSQVLNITRSSGATKSTVSSTSGKSSDVKVPKEGSYIVQNKMRDPGKRCVHLCKIKILCPPQNQDLFFGSSWK